MICLLLIFVCLSCGEFFYIDLKINILYIFVCVYIDIYHTSLLNYCRRNQREQYCWNWSIENQICRERNIFHVSRGKIVAHIILNYVKRRKWRVELLCKKWLEINDKLVHRTIINHINIIMYRSVMSCCISSCVDGNKYNYINKKYRKNA